MIKSALRTEDWEVLPFLTRTPKPEKPGQMPYAHDSCAQILAFLQEINASNGISPLFLATSLLEHRLKDPIQLEV